jgi:DNA-binding MarR family transcriptional regulator
VKERREPGKQLSQENKSPIHDLWILLSHTAYAVSRQREMEVARAGITIEQHAILHVLLIKDGRNIADISAVRLRQHNSIFMLINRMEKQGLVTKVKYPKNKEYKIYISDKGRQVYQTATIKSLEATFSALSAEDQQKLSQSLKLILLRSLSLQGVDYNLPFLL